MTISTNRTHQADSSNVAVAAQDAGCELLSVTGTWLKPRAASRHVNGNGRSPLLEAAALRAAFGPAAKRLFDVVASGIGLALLAPLFLTIAIAIKLDSRGPVFFRSERWGRFQRKIAIHKFRTMVLDAEGLLHGDAAMRTEYHANIKLADDPRVTRVGRWLRRFSIDELPQLINVFVGEMSLVGPRPKLIAEKDRYGFSLDTVLSIRPGMTGLWQVSGRNLTSYEERIALDLKYVSRPSFWWDLNIMLQTVPVVLKGAGAH